MSHDDLRALFTDLAEDVSRAQLVAPAVAGVARIRRRRRAVAGAAVAVAVVSGAGIALWPPTHRSSPIGSPGATARPGTAGTASVDRLPSAIAADRQARPYWPPSTNPPANAPILARAPISHAVMLFSPYGGDVEERRPIYVYGEGSVNGGSGSGSFHWARVEVDLSDTRDAGGNRAGPLDQNSLGPMGERAAFAQPDAVVVVHLPTGRVDRIALAGLNEDVSWLANGRHVLVSSATRTWLVDTQTRSAIPAAVGGAAVTPLVGGGSGLTTLTVPDPGGAPVVRFYDDGGLVERGDRVVDRETAAPYQIAYLSPRGWRYGDLIAQAASGQAGSTHADLVAVVDGPTGAVTDLLDLGDRQAKGCCAVLGWIGRDDVLVQTDREGLLRWQLATGTITRLTDLTPGAISVAPAGCDWTLTIAGVTSGCTA